ncbi:MAG: oligosaccharide flippase family protein [Sphingomonadaceae bacterium]|nr:oligosaccharide flippase family protein [Sphingomonadaceae bacterium]
MTINGGGRIDALSRPAATTVIRRLGRNAGWILSGRGVSGIVSLFYLAIVARALGPRQFGTFSLVLSYTGGLAALVTFQTSYAVIRFGSIHLAAGENDRLANLLGGLALLDVAAALFGALIAIAAVPFVGPLLGWSASEQHYAAAFSVILLLSSGATATGMLRLFDRFDLLAATETVGPLIRLIGACVCWLLGARLPGFLTVWALALAGEATAGWAAALWIKRTPLVCGPRSIRKMSAENDRIGSFLLHNNMVVSLSLVWEHAGTIMLGAVIGPAAAGGYRLASKLTLALGKPVESITRALYPELARLAVSDDRETLITVSRRITMMALAIAMVVMLVAALFGRDLLWLLYGRAYIFAAKTLFLLAIAAGLNLGGVALEPILNAHGLAGSVLLSHAVAALVLLALLAWFVPSYGAVGAGLAMIGATLVLRAATTFLVRRMLRQDEMVSL